MLLYPVKVSWYETLKCAKSSSVCCRSFNTRRCTILIWQHATLTQLKWLAGKLALQIPLEVILRDVRNTPDGLLTRLHIVTTKDLVNTEKAFHLNKPERHHSYDGKDNSPILAYKQQGTGHFDTVSEGVEASMATEDFFFAMMDGAQCQIP